MTAMNLIVQTGRSSAYLLTDTACFSSEDGRIEAFAPKVTGLSLQDGSFAAVTSAGRMFASHLRPHIAAMNVRRFSDLVAKLPDVFRAAEKASQDEGGAGPMAAVVAGFDQARKQPCGFVVGNDRSVFSALYTPYSLQRTRLHLTEYSRDFDSTADGIDFADNRSWNPESDGAALLKAQRADPFHFGYGVGGQGILTRVDAQGISHTTLITWPDRLHQAITIERDDRLTIWDRARAWRRERTRPAPLIRIAAK